MTTSKAHLLFASFFFVSTIFSESLFAIKKETVPRKVLILNFVNQADDKSSNYLSESIAEALLDPLKKTDRFYLMPRSDAGRATFDEDKAISLGKSADADVVVIGNFISIGGKVQIQTKALDVHTRQIAVAKTTNGKLDSTVFDLIQKLAKDMSSAMAHALPPMPKQVFVSLHGDKERFYAREFDLHFFMGAGLPLAKPQPFLGTAFVGTADLQFQFMNKYIQPHFSFTGGYATGAREVRSMSQLTYLAGLGFTWEIPRAFAIVRSLAVTPFLAAGGTFGTIRAAEDLDVQEFSYHVFTVASGVAFDFRLTENLSASLSLRAHYLTEQKTPLPVIYILMGVGYKL